MLSQTELDALRAPIRFEAEPAGRRLRFESTWGLFSPREIDAGTALLLRHLQVAPDADCLDLGCGYGVIGCTLAALAPQGQTLMVDKDFVAVDFARRNAALNGLDNAAAQLSNGFADIDPARRFDLVASNIPAKVGKELLTILLHDARARLNPGGQVYVVTVNGLREFMKRHLREVFGNYDKLKQGSHYTVALALR
ncbi:methyltransferase [uncultured Thiohalocapsa sp.]|uniref:class I SAM-dependent methyltransferase n=1 Tax=uncultured Thiohalocapsa sp. TaxID=768990 RepID=UPI0025E6782B|nr:methyltransferase [uncultured Thiohalocapsa sp.]